MSTVRKLPPRIDNNTSEEFQSLITKLLQLLGEDPSRPGLIDTPKRVEKSLYYLTSGYSSSVEEVVGDALFPSTAREMVLIKDIPFYSLCEHHMLPFYGSCTIAYIPNGKVLGLSKFARIVDVFAKRLQIQEELTEQVAEALFAVLAPEGVAVSVKAEHMCMQMRGVEKCSGSTQTTAYRGDFHAERRQEFLTQLAS